MRAFTGHGFFPELDHIAGIDRIGPNKCVKPRQDPLCSADAPTCWLPHLPCDLHGCGMSYFHLSPNWLAGGRSEDLSWDPVLNRDDDRRRLPPAGSDEALARALAGRPARLSVKETRAKRRKEWAAAADARDLEDALALLSPLTRRLLGPLARLSRWGRPPVVKRQSQKERGRAREDDKRVSWLGGG